jgi:hypothetical protein
MRRSIVLSLPSQLVFPGGRNKKWIIERSCERKAAAAFIADTRLEKLL